MSLSVEGIDYIVREGINPSHVLVDLDKTLAVYKAGDYDKYGHYYIGPPIEPMVELVKKFLDEGYEVRIFTARASDPDKGVVPGIESWAEEQFGIPLRVTNIKDRGAIVIYDDIARQVLANKGVVVGL